MFSVTLENRLEVGLRQRLIHKNCRNLSAFRIFKACKTLSIVDKYEIKKCSPTVLNSGLSAPAWAPL